MSRGPGRVERAIEVLLRDNPRRTFTGDELAMKCFPGINRAEKKHRVSTLRAASKVIPKLCWISRMVSGSTGSVVFFNPLDLRSFAIGMTRGIERGRPYDVRIPIRFDPVDYQINECRQRLGLDPRPDHRVAVRRGVLSEDESVHILIDGRKKPWIKSDGPYPVAVEAYRTETLGSDATDLWARYNKLVKKAVYLPDSIVGEIHPDFY